MKKVVALIAGLSLLTLSFASDAIIKLEKVSPTELNVALDATADVYGLQFDVVCNSKISEEKVEHAFADNDLRSNMSVYSRLRDDGSVRVIMFDMTGKSIVTANNVENVIAMTLNSNTKDNKCSCENVVLAGKNGGSFENVKPIYEDNQEIHNSAIPLKTKVKGNYPNPFNPTTTVEFDLADDGFVSIVIYDIQGRKVSELFNGELSKGFSHQYNWDASSIASGKYFAVVTAPNFTDTINMTLLK